MNKSVFFVLGVLSAVFCTARIQAADVTGKVSIDRLNVRSGAGLESPVVGRLAKDSTVTVLRKVGNWLEIAAPQTLKVYISEARVNPGGILNGELNIRSKMSTDAPILGVLPKGAKVERIDERNNGWVRIVPPASLKVYVAAFGVEFDSNALNGDKKDDRESKPAEKVAAPELPAAPEEKTPAAPAIIPAEKAENATLNGVLSAWKHSRSPETAYALLDAPNGRNLGFITAADPAILTGNDGKKVTVSGKITGRTAAGALVIEAAEITPAENK